MHTVLSTIQEMSQKRLKGRPNIIGSIRSQSETEKHIAANGISPSSKAAVDGFFTVTRLSDDGPSSISRLLYFVQRTGSWVRERAAQSVASQTCEFCDRLLPPLSSEAALARSLG